MKTVFNKWNRAYKILADDEVSLDRLDGFNQTRYSRRKNKEGLLELASREAHEKKRKYFATILNDDQTPYCFLECNDGYFYVGFLDEKLRIYMSYKFDDDFAPSEKLFLHTVYIFHFEDGKDDANRATVFMFNPNGEFKIKELNYRKNEQEILTPEKPLSPEVVKHLWVDYPEFGKYDELIKIDRVPPEVFEQFPNAKKS